MTQLIGLSATGFLVGATLSILAASASAKGERYPGINCKLVNPYNSQANYVSDSGWGTWLENRHTATQNFICPMSDETGMLSSNISFIIMTVHDNHTNDHVFAKVCGLWETEGFGPKDKINSGVACGFEGSDSSNPSMSYVGPSFLGPPLTSNNLPAIEWGETVYVWGTMPPAQNGNYSKLQSIYTWAN